MLNTLDDNELKKKKILRYSLLIGIITIIIIIIVVVVVFVVKSKKKMIQKIQKTKEQIPNPPNHHGII